MKKVRVFAAIPFVILGVAILAIGLVIGAGPKRARILIETWTDSTKKLMEGGE